MEDLGLFNFTIFLTDIYELKKVVKSSDSKKVKCVCLKKGVLHYFTKTIVTHFHYQKGVFRCLPEVFLICDNRFLSIRNLTSRETTLVVEGQFCKEV